MKQLNEIAITDIDFGQRLRKDYGTESELETFAADIRKVGLIHPVTVLDKNAIVDRREIDTIELDPSKRYLLMAGGRRFTVFTKFDLGEKIPAYIYPKVLGSDQIREIELIENLQRKELTWQERTTMTDEIHRLQQKMHGVKTTGGGAGHGLQETADLVGKSKSSVHRDIELAEALKAIPALAEFKTESEARKVLRQLKKSHKSSVRAQALAKEVSSDGYEDKRKEQLRNSYVIQNFFEAAEKLKPRSFDLVEIDPPYAIDLGNVKKEAKHTTLHYNEVIATEYRAFMNRTLAHCKRLLKPNGWLVLWYAIDPWHSMMVELLKENGFQLNELPALWIKNGGQTMQPERYFGSAYEPFLYARMSKDSKLNKPGAVNYLDHRKLASGKKIHPTQRPVELMEDVISRFIGSGTVLVPFAGSGVTIRAAHNLGLNSIGYDLSQEYKNEHDIIVSEQDLTKPFEE